MDGLPPHLQQERRRCVIADGARKRASWKWTRHGMPVPPSLLRREMEEFDLLHGLVPPPAPPAAVAPPAPPLPPALSAPPAAPAASAPPVDEHTSSGTWTLSPSPRSPVVVAVGEDGFEIYDPAAFDSSVTCEDFVPDEVLDTVTGAVEARSAEEVQTDAKRRGREVDIDQGLDQDRRHREQEASSKGKGKVIIVYVDDDSSDEE